MGDERVLTDTEVYVFCQHLLGRSKDDILPRDAHEFCLAVRERLPELALVYDPLRKSMVPPLRLEEVEWAVLPPGPLKRVCGSMCHFMRQSRIDQIARSGILTSHIQSACSMALRFFKKFS